MSRSSSNSSRTTGSNNASAGLDTVMVIRLVIASVIFAVSLILQIPELVSTVLLIVSAIVAGYDIVLEAVEQIKSGNIYSLQPVIILVAVLSFVIGFGLEGAALIILYQIGFGLISYASERTKKSALELLQYNDEETVSQVKDILSDPVNTAMGLENATGSAASFVLKAAMIFAVIFAVVCPIVTNMSFVVSIHRALTIIIVATPLSVVVSIPLANYVGLCYAAQFGVVFSGARAMEETAGAKLAVLDKAGVFTADCPKLVSVQPNILDKNTFMTFAAHAAYYSSQSFAKAISASWSQDYKLELVSNFVDIPGYGVDLKIGGAHVTLASRELFVSRGASVPFEKIGNDKVMYMTVSDKYVGYLVISDEINADAKGIVSELKAAGISKCVLLSEEGSDSTEMLASELDFDEYFGECDTVKKIKLVQDLSNSTNDGMIYIYGSGIETHSAANIDMRVSRKSKFADATIGPDYIANLPNALRVCHRVNQVSTLNAIFAFVVKALLIFLSIIGFCNVWFAIFIDMVAAVATILHTIRVTSNPIFNIKI